jgi:hypothetical protein
MTQLVPLIRRAEYVVSARVNWSRWLTDCPNPHCHGADMLDRHAPMFQCVLCGTVADVIWPSPEMVYGIERLLMMRPDEITRNWQPGETLVDLVMENGAHGVLDFPDFPEGYEPRLIVESERIRVDTLPSTIHRELRAAV